MPRNVSAEDLGLPLGTLVKVSRRGSRFYSAVDTNGVDITGKIAGYAFKNALRGGKALRLEATVHGTTFWKQVPLIEYDKAVRQTIVQTSDDSSLRVAEYSRFVSDKLLFFNNLSGWFFCRTPAEAQHGRAGTGVSLCDGHRATAAAGSGWHLAPESSEARSPWNASP